MVETFYLVRHGETQWSRDGRHTGRTDVRLSEAGERQAHELGERLKAMRLSHVLSSPRERARRTCELAGFGAAKELVADLSEWDYGDYEGRTTADIREQRPGWSLFSDGCPHGESVDEIGRRADRVLARLRDSEGSVAVFSHGHFLRALAARWIGLTVGTGEHLALDTGSLSILGYEHADRTVPAICQWNTR